jgi:hypothetical protein
MSLPDYFGPMLISMPRIGVVEQGLSTETGKHINSQAFSVIKIKDSVEALRIINGETKKGALVMILGENTSNIESIVASFRKSTRERVFKLLVITNQPGESWDRDSGIETMGLRNISGGDLNKALGRIDKEQGKSKRATPYR